MLSSFLYGPSLYGAGLAERAAADAGNRAEAATRTVKELESRVEKLTLVNLAIWSLLREKTGLKEEDLLDRVRQIDLQDGVLDGKLSRNTSECPKCHRVMSPRHKKCMYCGHEELVASAFDTL